MSSLNGMPDVAGWDAAVAAYADYAEPNTAAFAGLMLDLAGVRPGETALDVAAGTGALSLPLAAAGATVTAIDWSEGMVDFLSSRLAEASPDGAHRAVRMDGQALDLPDASFDLALSLFGVILFPDFRAGLAEMVRVTRPGGRVVVGCWTGLTAPMRLFHEAVAAVAPDLLPASPIAGMEAMGAPDGFTAELTRLGLRSIATRRVTLPWRNSRREVAELADRMLYLMPPWPMLSEDQRRETVSIMAQIAERDRDLPFESSALVGVGFKRG